jgi:hypothetical protein
MKRNRLLNEIVSIITSSAISGKGINIKIQGSKEIESLKEIAAISSSIRNHDKKDIIDYYGKIRSLHIQIQLFHNLFLNKK